MKLDPEKIAIFKQLESIREDLIKGKRSKEFSLDDLAAGFELPASIAEDIPGMIRREKMVIIRAYDRAKRPDKLQADLFAKDGWIPQGGNIRINQGFATAEQFTRWSAIETQNFAGQTNAYYKKIQHIADNISAFAKPEFRKIRYAIDLWPLAFGYTPRIDPLPFDLDDTE